MTPDSRKIKLDNFAEVQDKDFTLKTVCRRCGGEGAYVMQWMDPKTMEIVKKEVLKCDECEDGFKYGINKGHCTSGRSGNTGIPDNSRR